MLLQYQLVRSKTDSRQQNINAQARVAYGGKQQATKKMKTFHTPQSPFRSLLLQKLQRELQSENFSEMSLLPFASILAPRSTSYQPLQAQACRTMCYAWSLNLDQSHVKSFIYKNYKRSLGIQGQQGYLFVPRHYFGRLTLVHTSKHQLVLCFPVAVI